MAVTRISSWLDQIVRQARALAIAAVSIFAVPLFCHNTQAAFVTKGRCGPYPRLAVKTPPWLCAGVVLTSKQGLKWPRTIVPLSEKQFAITDAAGWHGLKAGRILSLTLDGDGKPTLATLAANRTLPHGLALGPDGLLYGGDDSVLWRLDPKASEPVIETLRDGLPGKYAKGEDRLHPFKQILFDRDNNLIVNFGAPGDICEIPRKKMAEFPCKAAEGDKSAAALWKLTFKWPQGTPGTFEPYARGLRNSMALALNHKTGELLQADNSLDHWDRRFQENMPPDELNLIEAGKHYGWPYCTGMGAVVPEYRGKTNCKAYAKPLFLIPAHAAPLAMTYYQGGMFPELSGKLLLTLHGFGAHGHRVVAYDADEKGLPKAPGKSSRASFPPLELLNTARGEPQSLVRASGMAVGRDGAIWLIDDVERAVIVLLRTSSGAEKQPAQAEPQPETQRAPPASWQTLHQKVLRPRCGQCHKQFALPESAKAWQEAVSAGFADRADLSESLFARAMLKEGGARPMPPTPEPALSEADLALLKEFLRR